MKVFQFLTLLLAMAFGAVSSAAPSENFVLKETEPVNLENIQWHDREGGWLFTCRLTVRSEHLLKPVTYLEFAGIVGEGEEIETIWTQKKVIHRRKLDSKLGGSVSLFVRVHVVDFPDEAEGMTLRFVNEPPSSSGS